MRRGDKLIQQVKDGDTVTVRSGTMALAIKREVECTCDCRCDWSWDPDALEWTLKLRDREAVR